MSAVHVLLLNTSYIFMSYNFTSRDFERPFVLRPAFSVNPLLLPLLPNKKMATFLFTNVFIYFSIKTRL